MQIQLSFALVPQPIFFFSPSGERNPGCCMSDKASPLSCTSSPHVSSEPKDVYFQKIMKRPADEQFMKVYLGADFSSVISLW